ncbi:MAG: CHRD domain-containing protein [Acidobacteriota bacterium]|nr:CHRD domain-containing protein [Acidobacteriota bacterium]
MKKTIFLSVVLTGLLVSGSVAKPSEQGEAAILKYTATLLGSGEFPAAGDSTAVGFAVVTVDTSANTVSWVILSPDLTNVSASHIHEAPPGASSSPVIPFNQPFTNGVSTGTATVSAAIIGRLVGNPAGFYVNVHNTAFPGGAIRGQLTPAPLVTIGTCNSDGTTLCLNQGRFKVQVAFQTSTANGVGNAIPLTGDTGSFWFFSPGNLELMIKVVDGRAVNGKFWFFAGALSDVAYTITVTDLTTGTVKTYVATQGRQAALNDTSAF